MAYEQPVIESSPHAWGCFLLCVITIPSHVVFPTRVGVFLAIGSLQCGERRLPHTRGGVSQKNRQV